MFRSHAGRLQIQPVGLPEVQLIMFAALLLFRLIEDLLPVAFRINFPEPLNDRLIDFIAVGTDRRADQRCYISRICAEPFSHHADHFSRYPADSTPPAGVYCRDDMVHRIGQEHRHAVREGNHQRNMRPVCIQTVNITIITLLRISLA